jgi:adenylylsulfate kinase-like enzyme
MSGTSGVVWITGLSAAGKTTLGEALTNEIRKFDLPVLLLDRVQNTGCMRADMGGKDLKFYSRITRLVISSCIKKDGQISMFCTSPLKQNKVHCNDEI